MAALKPIKIAGHTITLSAAGFLGYVHYTCKRDADGATIASGGISRHNYATSRAHKAAIVASCKRSILAKELLIAAPSDSAKEGV